MVDVATQKVFDAAWQCLACTDPSEKVSLTEAVAAALLAGRLHDQDSADATPIGLPGRPARPHLVAPRQLASRGFGSLTGRAALVHAVAHIEFNAINLAWDAIYRFRGMPLAYYRDWASIAADEARHFCLLRARLADMGFAYGDFDAHDGLWQMALQTADSCLARMALVPRVLEARGLDVTPGMIERFRRVGDAATVTILETILRDEIGHVAAGSRWFAWCCERAGLDAELAFERLLNIHLPGGMRGPFNFEARLCAGFSSSELERLREISA